MTAPTLPHLNDLYLTDDEMKFVHALVAYAYSPVLADQGRRRGVIGLETGLDEASQLMIRVSVDTLGEQGIQALFEKTRKLAAPLILQVVK